MPNIYPHLNDGTDSPQSIYESDAIQAHPLGTVAWVGPRKFYYAKSSGAAITKGNLCRVAAGLSTYASMSCESAAAGATSVTVTLGTDSVSANQFAGGTFVVIDGTGVGQERIVKSHPSAAGSATLVVTLEEGLEDALVAADEATLRVNIFNNVVVTPGDAEVLAAGVPQFDVPSGASTSQYFWLQTAGPGVITRDGGAAATAGQGWLMATTSTAAAGWVSPQATASSASDATAAAGLLRAPVAKVIDTGDTSAGDALFADLCIR